MIGAIIGDIVGSIYEFDNIKTKNFHFFSNKCFFTDDTVMTLAVAKALLEYESVDGQNVEAFKNTLVSIMHTMGELYPNRGYGARFDMWLRMKDTIPYNSFGNGSAMRVSPAGWYAKTLEEAEFLAKATAEVTHNHPEGVKGAVATAGAVFLAKNGASIDEIKNYVSGYYTIAFTLDSIRDSYAFNETCQETVPQALQAFLESTSFEDAIRNAISLGGDSDTLTAITGAVAEAYYTVDKATKDKALSYLDDYLLNIVKEFEARYLTH